MKKTRLLALLTVAVMFAASCGALASAPVLPISPEPITFTAMLYNEEQDGRWEDLELLNWLESVTNVHFDYEQYVTVELFREQLFNQFHSFIFDFIYGM